MLRWYPRQCCGLCGNIGLASTAKLQFAKSLLPNFVCQGHLLSLVCRISCAKFSKATCCQQNHQTTRRPRSQNKTPKSNTWQRRLGRGDLANCNLAGVTDLRNPPVEIAGGNRSGIRGGFGGGCFVRLVRGVRAKQIRRGIRHGFHCEIRGEIRCPNPRRNPRRHPPHNQPLAPADGIQRSASSAKLHFVKSRLPSLCCQTLCVLCFEGVGGI